MNVAQVRDATKLRREHLLDDYLRIAKSRGDALVATALRTKSVTMRDIFTHGAITPQRTSEELKEAVLSGRLDPSDVVEPNMLGELGRLVLLQNILKDDLLYGETLLTIAHKMKKPGTLSAEARRTLIQHQVLKNNNDAAQDLLDQSPDIDHEFFGYLRAELLNPFVNPRGGSYDAWLQNFNEFFTSYDLAPIAIDRDSAVPFDGIWVPEAPTPEGSEEQGPLISVVLTAYQPEATKLISSVRSILDQSWMNLELIVVDDCSGPDYAGLFRQIEELDDRVKVLHASVNRGTYIARNLGYAEAAGEFITGQDDDDWSHPQRLARQVAFMIKNPEYGACRIMAVRCDENLGRLRLGYKPVVYNPSSLMIRRSVYESVGDHLASRKGADSEYYFRVKAATGGQVANIEEPLSIIRILPESLSRGDFSAGWRHPARSSFRSAFRYWHRNASPEALKVTAQNQPPVRTPRRFGIYETKRQLRHFDVVFAGDWQRYGGPQKSMLEEIAALLESGYKVGIMNLEAARFMSEGASEPLNDEIQRLINNDVVEEVFFDDQDVNVRLMILRYPPILQFMTHEPSRLDIDSMIIVANQAPSELDGTDVRYIVHECHENAESAFDVTPLWVPQGPQVRDLLKHYLDDCALADFDMPGILDLDYWWQERLWYRSALPVVGRHSRDDRMKWPASGTELEKAYPTDGRYDIRLMGGHRTPLKVLGIKRVPIAWTVYKKDEMPVRDFLYSLDYFVFYQHPQAVEAFGRAILEALAAGVVVILPKHFERVFGDAALYADIDEVHALINKLHSDFSVYRKQLKRSRAILEERFSYSSYRQAVERLFHKNF